MQPGQLPVVPDVPRHPLRFQHLWFLLHDQRQYLASHLCGEEKGQLHEEEISPLPVRMRLPVHDVFYSKYILVL